MDGGEFLPMLREQLSGKCIDKHPIIIRSVTAEQLTSESGLHILLVTRAANKTPEAIRSALGSQPTLLVGDSDQFAERGGMIAFVREGDKIRLNLNLDQTTEVGLVVNSQLSVIARLVKTRSSQ